MEMEFVLADSIAFDEQQILRIPDYDESLGRYLMVNWGLEGKYFIIDKEGNQITENILSEGPDSFGMVLHRAGFVGDEILFSSDQRVFVYDLNLKQLRKFPFEQDAKVRLIIGTSNMPTRQIFIILKRIINVITSMKSERRSKD